jgi:hypothetical protein
MITVFREEGHSQYARPGDMLVLTIIGSEDIARIIAILRKGTNVSDSELRTPEVIGMMDQLMGIDRLTRRATS